MKSVDITHRLNVFQEACERLGLKITHQRMEIYRAVIMTENHPDAVSVYHRVKKRIPMISLDTVYRNLKLLAKHGLISIVGLSQESLRFDGNMTPHHHFACVKCGMIRDFNSPAIGHLPIPEEVKGFGSPVSVHLEVKGLCATCKKSSRRN
ncbi:MAG TPA: transcriptional repressor [Candidatus Hydrogenedentes bacterium]|nr:transcriptional repressor [Candidatus Hydrogenedentota bacterium]